MVNQFGFGMPTANVTRFLIIIIGLFLAFAVLGHTSLGGYVYSKLVLNPYQAIYSGEVWRVFTYGFLHDANSPLHVIFNGLMLYMIGPQLEDRWGEKRFLLFILCAVLLGGLFVCLSFILGLSSSYVVGFSAATIALLIAWGLTYPQNQMYVFGILPLTGRQMVYGTIGLEVIFSVSSNGISSAAHFGGIATAFIFTMGWYKPQRLKQLWNQAKIKRNMRIVR